MLDPLKTVRRATKLTVAISLALCGVEESYAGGIVETPCENVASQISAIVGGDSVVDECQNNTVIALIVSGYAKDPAILQKILQVVKSNPGTVVSTGAADVSYAKEVAIVENNLQPCALLPVCKQQATEDSKSSAKNQ